MTVDTFESPRTCESPETSTVTRMATLPSAIPVSVESKNVDSYEDGDGDPRDPCDS